MDDNTEIWIIEQFISLQRYFDVIFTLICYVNDLLMSSYYVKQATCYTHKAIYILIYVINCINIFKNKSSQCNSASFPVSIMYNKLETCVERKSSTTIRKLCICVSFSSHQISDKFLTNNKLIQLRCIERSWSVIG